MRDFLTVLCQIYFTKAYIIHFLMNIMNNIHFISIPEGELEAANLGRGYIQNYPRKQKMPSWRGLRKIFLINKNAPRWMGRV